MQDKKAQWRQCQSKDSEQRSTLGNDVKPNMQDNEAHLSTTSKQRSKTRKHTCDNVKAKIQDKKPLLR